MAKTNFVGSHLPIVKWLTFGRGDFAWGLDAEDNPLMKVSQRRSGGCWCGFSTLDGVVEGEVKCSCSGFGAVVDDERKVAGKRNYFTAVVVVVM
jgi:hypothetical protein